MMRRSALARFLFALAFVIGALLARPSAALAQCAMCGAAAASSRGVARGLAFSIFFLLGTLFLVVVVLRAQALARKSSDTAAREREAPSISAASLPTGHAPAEK